MKLNISSRAMFFYTACLALLPLASSADWIYDAGVITDENGITCNVTLSGNNLTINANGTTLPEGITELDFTKTITSADGQTQYNLVATAADCWSGNSVITKVLLPETFTTIGRATFNGCSALTEVVLPTTSLISIGESAFQNATSLANVVPFLPDTVTSIGDRAFYNCKNLALDLKLNSSSPMSFGSYPHTGIFENCTKLTSVTFGEGVSLIRPKFLKGASSLTNVTFVGNVTSIGNEAFNGASSLTEIFLPDSLTYLGDYAFQNATSLTNVVPFLSDSITYVGSCAFYNCKNLALELKINSSSPVSFGTYPHSGIFENCTKLPSAVLGEGVTSIPTKFFKNTTSLTNVTFAGAITSIGNEAFYGDTALVNITPFLPDTVTYIGLKAFCNCNKLASDLKINSSSPVSFGSDAHGGIFQGCSKISSATLGEGVTTVPLKFLSGATSLTNVTFAGALTSIGNEAFYGDRELVNITPFLPDTVTYIGLKAFTECNKLASDLKINSSSPVSFGNDPHTGIFQSCSKIPSATLGEGVTTVPLKFLSGATSLTNVTFAGAITSIGNEAFRNNTALVNVTPLLPDTVTNMGYSVFYNTPALKKDGSIASKDPVALAGASGWGGIFNSSAVTSMIFGPGVTKVPYSCFNGNSAISNVVIQSDEIYFDNYAFSSAYAMREIQFAKGVPTWASYGGSFSAFQTRFIVPHCAAWDEFCADAEKVQPASAFTESEWKSYYDKFGATAKKPAGYTLTYPVKQYIVFKGNGTLLMVR